MKKILLLFAILFLGIGVFSSCNKDNGGGSSSSLVGTWGMVKEEIIKKEDGTMSRVEYYDSSKYKIVFTESTVSLYIDNGVQYTLAYHYDSSTKRLVYGANEDVVQKLTAKELVLKSINEGVDWYNILYLEKK